jgi:AbrB family looped-hinge helix DNA binding protein
MLSNCITLGYFRDLKIIQMETATITAKGQLLIPKRLRNKYGIQPGVKVAMIEMEGAIKLQAMNKAYFDNFSGMFKDALPSTEDFVKMKIVEKQVEERK